LALGALAATLLTVPAQQQSVGATLNTIFASATHSPAGVEATSFGRDASLQRANAFLHGLGQAVDRQEAAFWLRRAVAQSFSDPRNSWALTQLGSIYASPGATQQPDYAAAALLWELAGANGDPVALCFLGQMYRQGLGVRADKAAALQHYERAKSLGGCAGIEAVLADLKG
jgi:TPR repeat protein